MPPVLRGRDGALVVADRETAWPGVDVAIGEVVAQLVPIRSHESLASSFSREANWGDAVIRAAYVRVWADIALVIARRTIRRARIRSMTSPLRRRRG